MLDLGDMLDLVAMLDFGAVLDFGAMLDLDFSKEDKILGLEERLADGMLVGCSESGAEGTLLNSNDGAGLSFSGQVTSNSQYVPVFGAVILT